MREYHQRNNERDGRDDGPDRDERELAALIALSAIGAWHVLHGLTMPRARTLNRGSRCSAAPSPRGYQWTPGSSFTIACAPRLSDGRSSPEPPAAFESGNTR